MTVCPICYRIHNQPRYCGMSCVGIAKTDQSRWNVIVDKIIPQGWLPDLLSAYCPAVADPKDRIRISGAVYLQRDGDGWYRLGIAGARIDRPPERVEYDGDPDHCPWPHGEYLDLAVPLDELLVASIPRSLLVQYARMIRSFASAERIDRFVTGDIGPPPRGCDPRPWEEIKQAELDANTPPILPDWKAAGLLDSIFTSE